MGLKDFSHWIFAKGMVGIEQGCRQCLAAIEAHSVTPQGPASRAVCSISGPAVAGILGVPS